MPITSINLGYCLWQDGMTWTSLLQRQFESGAALWDANTSTTGVNPLGGVIPTAGGSLQVVQNGTPNMTVLVNAGYCAVANLTQGNGAYVFGLLAQGTLTVASNPAGSTRIDLVIARVYDLGSSSSYCDIEIVQGTAGQGQPATPGTSILLATVSVVSGATSITTSKITDERTWTVAPGGMLPVASVGAAPPLAPGQLVWSTGQGAIERAASTYTETFTFDSAGTYSQGVPVGTIQTIVQGWAAGAGGGGSASDDASGGAGGGGGEYIEDDDFPAIAGDVINITVGAGGTGSAPGQDDSAAGGDTVISYGATTWTANGGQPGMADSVETSGAEGAGGTGSNAPIHFDGGDGGEGDNYPNSGGGGGGSGGPGSAGNDGGTGGLPRNGEGGYGAPAVPGGGPGGQGGSAYSDGQSPYTGPGGGGGGAAGAGNYSGDGADGQVIVTCVIQPSALTALAGASTEFTAAGTSTGTSGSSGENAGDPASGYGWGIGYGSASYYGSYGFDTDNGIIPEMQVTFTADGSTDFQFDAKWGMAVPEAAVDGSSPSIPTGQCRILLYLDGNLLDMVYLACSASGGVTHPGQPGSWTYYTSAGNGTTPSAGTHTLLLAIETRNTNWGQYSGAHIGDVASVATSPKHPLGTVPSWFTSALVAENCSLRAAGILASAI